MSKRIRQYFGIMAAILAYYLVHEGAHFLCAVLMGAFRKIVFQGIGVQIDVYAERMTSEQLGFFCLAGAVATLLAAYTLVLLRRKICSAHSPLLRAVCYYSTIAYLLIDPLYLSVLCGFFGGGDMNGIRFLCPEWAVRSLSGAVFVMNVFVFWRVILPTYQKSFESTNEKCSEAGERRDGKTS